MNKKRVVVVALALPTRELVLQRRDGHAPTSPNLLTFFGGSCDSEEDQLHAAIREVHEETGLYLSNKSISKIGSAMSGDVQIYAYFAKIDTMLDKIYEGRQAEKYTIEELVVRNDIAPITLRVLESMKEEILWHLE